MSHHVTDFIKDCNEDLIKCSSYSVAGKLGSGTQGLILLVKKSNEYYAAKVFSYESTCIDLKFGASNPFFEIRFGLLVKHPYIVEGKDFVVGKKYIFYIMEKAEKDLGTFLNSGFKFTPREKLQNIFNLGCALNYIHRSGFVHGDIKSINVLMKEKRLLLGDFGLISLLEDVDPDKPFQTLHHRAPEHINNIDLELSIYRDIYSKNIGQWKTNYKASEVWSFGVLCLDIMYNHSNISISNSIQKWTRLDTCTSKKELEKYPYATFINVLAKNSERVSPFLLVKDMLGDVSYENQPLLKLICEKLLIVDQSKRSSLEDFLKSDLFYLNGLVYDDTSPTFKYPYIQKMFIPSPIFEDMSYIKVLVEWLIEISNDLRLYPIIIMNTIDYIIQRTHVKAFMKNVKDIQLFGLCALWIIMKIFNSEVTLAIYDLRKLSNYIYSTKDFHNMILKIIKYENGIFYFESIYFQLPSEELLLKALDVMRDPKKYISYGSPHNLSNELLKEENDEEYSSRTLKYIREFVI